MIEIAAMAREPALNLPNPWAAVGRDTEAGRALFALYNGFGHARNRGNDYSQRNRERHLRHVALHGVPEYPAAKPLPLEKPKVSVPHFSARKSEFLFHPVDFIPRRRRAGEILRQMRDESYEAEAPPVPKGPLLDDAEKARLQEIFYWSNRSLAPETSVAAPVKRIPRKGSVEEQEALLNEIAAEIEDREAFLREMEDYGKGDQYRSQIMFEIQQRVGQMKLLHESITQTEKNLETKTSSSPRTSLTISPLPPPIKSHARGQPRSTNLRLDLDVTGASLPHFDQDPRFEKSSQSHDLISTSTRNARTYVRTDQPANVIKTAAMTTPQASSRAQVSSRARPEISNLNLDRFRPSASSPIGSAARCSSSSVRSNDQRMSSRSGDVKRSGNQDGKMSSGNMSPLNVKFGGSGAFSPCQSPGARSWAPSSTCS